MYLTELFTRVSQWEYEEHKPRRIRASFNIGDYVYRVYMDTTETSASPAFTLGGPVESFPQIWDITFSVSPITGRGDGWGEEDDITGTGNAIAVFSTVIDIIQETVKSHNIQNLYFTAHEPSRIKLYDRMAKHFESKGWRYLNNSEINARGDGVSMTQEHSFLLTKQPHPHSLLKGTKHD